MSPYVAEFIGTMLLILFGNGVVANVLLKRTNGNDAGWIVISAGWGVAVYVGAFCSNAYSGAQLNPAVTVATMLNGDLSYQEGAVYILAQFLGAMLGALLVFLFYREHFEVTQDPDAKLACFSTAPNIRKLGQAFFCEMIGTFALILPIFLIAAPSLVHGDAPAESDPTLGRNLFPRWVGICPSWGTGSGLVGGRNVHQMGNRIWPRCGTKYEPSWVRIRFIVSQVSWMAESEPEHDLGNDFVSKLHKI